MIKRDNKKIIGIANDRYRLKKVYRSGYLIWSSEGGDSRSQSCFGNGYWIDEFPWIDEDAWKDND